MADESDLIRQEMESTRSRLAESLNRLTQQTSGTVASVGSTVSEVTETVQSVTEQVKETFSGVRDFFDLPGQIQKRPLLMVGGAVLAGYVVGVLLSPRKGPEHAAPPAPPAPPEKSHGRTRDSGSANGQHAQQGQRHQRRGPQWMNEIAQWANPLFGSVTSLAMETTLNVARGLLNQSQKDHK